MPKTKEDAFKPTVIHATARMSSKGQLVIPDVVRTALGLESGQQFVILSYNDLVILKKVHPPVAKDFRALLVRASKAARKAGITTNGVKEAVKEVRRSKPKR